MMPPFGADMVKSVMKSENLEAFLKTDERFDVCIMELFGNEALMVSDLASDVLSKEKIDDPQNSIPKNFREYLKNSIVH